MRHREADGVPAATWAPAVPEFLSGLSLAQFRHIPNKNVWLANLLNRRHPNIAAVPLANKNVRSVWALLAHGRDFKPDYVPLRAGA